MWKLALCVALLCCGSGAAGISCKDEGGKDVDWFILYKLPHGFDYYSIVPAEDPKLSKKPINHQDGFLAKTLAPYFDKKPGIGYIAYNDQPPKCDALKEYGHGKGFVMMEEASDSGIWLLHSTPRFPYKRASNSFFPDSGETNGQTFICVTFPYDTFKDIGQHLLEINIYSFDHNIPSHFHEDLRKAADVFRDPVGQATQSKDLTSKGGQDFRRFVHNTNKGKSLYVAIGRNIGTVDVQTWQSKDSSDKEFDNVKCIGVEKENWKPTKDHSKWCVSRANDWTCFADLNSEQFQRPGGALCIKDHRVKDIFRGFIKDEKDCDSKRPR